MADVLTKLKTTLFSATLVPLQVFLVKILIKTKQHNMFLFGFYFFSLIYTKVRLLTFISCKDHVFVTFLSSFFCSFGPTL